jgi:hypothetical protein
MIAFMLEPGGLHYDVDVKEIAALTPRPAFLPILRLLEGVTEYEEATGTLVATAELTGSGFSLTCASPLPFPLKFALSKIPTASSTSSKSCK